jgi:catechol 2,3-dioxygenase-like lactoylglutathione lyase family enzyme
MTANVRQLVRIGLTVNDLDRASAFYREALGFRSAENQPSPPRKDGGSARDGVRSERLRLGSQEIELCQFHFQGEAYPADSTAADLWFQHFAIVTRDIESAVALLVAYGANPITLDGPQRLPPVSGSVVAYKFRDPDGHPLELIQFPRGSAGFAQPSGSVGPTVGIDHSALSVADADRSIAFYAALGLSLGSRQLNIGPAQDRLDGLSGVSVEVVAMLPAETRTPHVELLSYDAPRGRAAHPASSGRDIADSSLIFEVADLRGLIDNLATAGISTVISSQDGASISAAELRDPDGHRIVLLQAT